MTPGVVRSVAPSLDGGSVTLGDGTARTRAIIIPAGEFATPFWLQTGDGVAVRVDSLPWQGVISTGSVNILSTNPDSAYPMSGDIDQIDFEEGSAWVDANGDRSGSNFQVRRANSTRISIVTNDPDVGTPGCAVWNDGSGAITPNCGQTEDTAWDSFPGYPGEYAMRFRFAAGQGNTWMDFDLGASYTEFSMIYWLHVPPNYDHDEGSGGNNNNKWLSLWPNSHGDYDNGNGGTLTLQTRPPGGTGPDSNLVWQIGGGVTGELNSTAFIDASEDQDKWMQFGLYVKWASGVGQDDGIYRSYRRFNGEQSWTIIHERTDVDLWLDQGGVTQGVRYGRMFGQANAPYTSETEWIVDRIDLHSSDYWLQTSQVDAGKPHIHAPDVTVSQ